MKKILSLFLVFLIILSLCACGGAEETGGETESFDTLQVGFGKAKIQPPDTSIRLTGGGDLSMVIAPYEMFSTSARTIKTDTPFDMTFILAYTNGTQNYIPTAEAYEYNDNVGSNEAYNTPWPKGTDEALTDKYQELLNQLKDGE